MLIHFPEGLAAQRLLLVGAGKPEKFAVERSAQDRRHRAALFEIARREEVSFSSRAKASAARRPRRPSSKGLIVGRFRIGQVPHRKEARAKFSPFRWRDLMPGWATASRLPSNTAA